MNNYNSYSSEFSETSFWCKIKNIIGKAGREILIIALELFYAYKDGDLTAAQKASVLGALGYLILPIDLIPDCLPVIGFSDDLAALTWAYSTVSSAITPAIKEKARRQIEDLLG